MKNTNLPGLNVCGESPLYKGIHRDAYLEKKECSLSLQYLPYINLGSFICRICTDYKDLPSIPVFWSSQQYGHRITREPSETRSHLCLLCSRMGPYRGTGYMWPRWTVIFKNSVLTCIMFKHTNGGFSTYYNLLKNHSYCRINNCSFCKPFFKL